MNHLDMPHRQEILTAAYQRLQRVHGAVDFNLLCLECPQAMAGLLPAEGEFLLRLAREDAPLLDAGLAGLIAVVLYDELQDRDDGPYSLQDGRAWLQRINERADALHLQGDARTAMQQFGAWSERFDAHIAQRAGLA